MKLKLSDYFLLPGVRTLSILFGIIAGFAVWLFTIWQYAVLTGAGVALVASVALPISLYREDLPYARIKETIKQPFLFDERVRFTVRGGATVGGFFVLTEKSMVFLSMEKGNHRLELNREDVKSVVWDHEHAALSIFLNNTQFIRVVAGNCEEMYGILRENGWAF